MQSSRNIIITGASKGIGRAIALRLAAGNHLVLTGRNGVQLESLATEVKQKGGSFEVHIVDLTRKEELEKFTEKVKQNNTTIDVLINNAGVGYFNRIDKFDDEEFDTIMKLNVYAPYYLCRAFAPVFISQKHGQVINISSVAGLNGFKSGTAYAASKHALNGFTESLREDLKEFGVAVTALCPGSVRTEFG